MNEFMKTKFHEKYPFVTLLVGVLLVLILYVAWPQGKAKKSDLETVEEMQKYKIGEVLAYFNIEYIVRKIELTKTSPIFHSEKLPDDIVYLVLNVDVKNTSTAPSEIKCGKLWAVFDGKLLEFECNRRLSAASGVFTEINPQIKRTVSIYYEISSSALGPFAWGPFATPIMKFSIGDTSGGQLMDFRGSTKGARELILTTLTDLELLAKINKAYKIAGKDLGSAPNSTPYKYALVDLDSDGKNEIFVMRGGVDCGIAGCGLDLLKYEGDLLKVTGNSWLADDRIWIFPTKNQGMFDLSLGDIRYRFNGAVYESN